ncbi:DUF1559 domain-containing protein [Botrimarina hoheduenensis]|uniref:DUF1559 domain-containing protein n=1 Tax=Botrimarina hoheduenensis TaxID=2528000 RepID=A0A5C5VQ92_9BACT|nr:DUF1559 domain-containing protein [Botrimarina hoheduenensis]TWT40796.1 hypothetical protein Pla111_32140 [Botrimarina hoheduenensis]
MGLYQKWVEAAAYRSVLTAAVVLAPLAHARAQAVAKPTSPPALGELAKLTSIATPQTLVRVELRPRRVLLAPELSLMPIEVVTAAGLQELGFDPTTLESLEVVVEPPMGTRLYYAVLARFSEPFALDQIPAKLLEHFQLTEEEGSIVRLEATDPQGPTLVMLDDKTALAASEGMLKKLTRRAGRPTEGAFTDWIANQEADADLHVTVNYQPLAPLVDAALAAGGDEIPDTVRPYLKHLNDIRYAKAWLRLFNQPDCEVAIEAKDDAAADRLAGVVNELLALQQRMSEESIAQLDPTDPLQEAMIRYQRRTLPQYQQMLVPQRDGLVFGYHPTEMADSLQVNSMLQISAIGILVALLLPAVQAAREAARRNSSMYNLKKLIVALLVYEGAYGNLPAQAITDDEGQPLLSWRVAILPFLEKQALYDQFHLDEPWDSPHNLSLLPLMPEYFIDPSGSFDGKDGKTHYLAAFGPAAVCDGGSRGKSFRDIRDGTSPTIAVIQVDDQHAVEWTRPADYDVAAYDRNPVEGIGSLHPGGFLAAFCDGHVSFIASDVDIELLRAMLTIDGGERIELP